MYEPVIANPEKMKIVGALQPICDAIPINVASRCRFSIWFPSLPLCEALVNVQAKRDVFLEIRSTAASC